LKAVLILLSCLSVQLALSDLTPEQAVKKRYDEMHLATIHSSNEEMGRILSEDYVSDNHGHISKRGQVLLEVSARKSYYRLIDWKRTFKSMKMLTKNVLVAVVEGYNHSKVDLGDHQTHDFIARSTLKDTWVLNRGTWFLHRRDVIKYQASLDGDPYRNITGKPLKRKK
jgi:hypothetical protein